MLLNVCLLAGLVSGGNIDEESETIVLNAEIAMPVSRCACPSCRWVFRIPDDMLGKRTKCSKCGVYLTIRAMGGKTALELAGVDGHARTTLERTERDDGAAASALDQDAALVSAGPAYKWNVWQITAFLCWIAGALAVLIPAVAIIRTFRGDARIDDVASHVVALTVGVVLLATGGTLHQVGTGRERKH